MDYSNYYLKNYFKNRNSAEDEPEPAGEEFVQDDMRQPEYADEDERVEIEVVPQLTSMVKTNYELGADDAIVDIIPQNYDRGDSKRRVWIVSLAIITCLLLTVVIGDFATNGALLAGVSSLYRTQTPTKGGYYALVLKTGESYSSAKIFGDQLRLVGGAGYIVKSGEQYLVIGDIYDDLSEANAVVEKNEGSSLVSYTPSDVDFEKIYADCSQLMQSMGGYSISIVNRLAKIGDELASQQIDKLGAIAQIESMAESLQVAFDELNAESDTAEQKVKALLSDINVTLGLLSNLCSDNVSRPNLLCDIRYTKVQLVINYCQLYGTK